MLNIGMIFQIRIGLLLNLIYQGKKDNGVELQKIIVCLSTLYSGFYAQVRPGEIYHPNMANGEQYISVLFVGEINESGKNCLRY